MKLPRFFFLLILSGGIVECRGQNHKVIGPVKDFQYSSDESSFYLQWKSPENWELICFRYKITYKNLGKKPTFCRETSLPKQDETAISNSYTIRNLQPFSKYEVGIQAEEIAPSKDRGNILWHNLYTSGMNEMEEGEVDGVIIRKLNTNQENITFQIENLNCSKIQGELKLIIKVYVENKYQSLHYAHVEYLDRLTTTFNPLLKPSTDYKFESWLCRHECIRISQEKFRTSSSSAVILETFSFDVKWNINNTVKLFWNFSNEWKATVFAIMIMEQDNTYQTFNYSVNFPYSSSTYNFLVPEVYNYSSFISIQIAVYNNKTHINQSSMITTSSYPPLPYWMNLNISSESDSSTITVNLEIGQEKVFLSARYLFILINDGKRNKADQNNVKKLRGILNTNFYKGRIVGRISLLDNNVTYLHYQIGNLKFPLNFSTSTSSVLSQIEYNNAPLEQDLCYNVTILPVNEFHDKYTFKKYYFRLCTSNSFIEGMLILENTNAWWILVLLLVSATVATFVLYKKKKVPITKEIFLVSADYSVRNTYNNKVRTDEESSTLKFATNDYEEIRENDLNNFLNRMSHKEVEVQNFAEYVRRSIENGELQKQHAILPKKLLHPCEAGKDNENRLKNRYSNLIAYDHSRVKLAIKAENGCSDYINANYINDNNEKKAYIATQGPLPQTIVDFWRMIWQERVKLIVMLANIYEDGKKRVEQYWPDKNEKKIYGNICIRYRSVELFADYEYRIFSVTCDGEMRQVHQIHFTSWPGQCVPLYSHSLRPIMKRMLETAPSFDNPIVVHCSAGIGRTGIILLSDICMRMAKEKGVVNMIEMLRRLREQRPNMVDNEEQYKLAHLVVLDGLMALSTDIKCDSHLKYSVQRILNTNEHKIQFQYLEENEWQDEVMKSVAECSGSYMNYSEKNRIQTVVPENQERICLSKYPDYDESSSYINAIWVNGYRWPRKFIVTQQPMPNTLGDFWRLIVEKKIKIVISLNEINLINETTCRFWPNQEELTIRPVDFMTVIFDEVVDLGHCNVYSVTVVLKEKEEEEINIKIYSMKNWSVSLYLPPNCEEFLSLLDKIEDVSDGSSHIVLTCLDGVTASGIYVALSFVIEKMKVEQICDICLSVRTIRHNRKQFIINDIQYGFLYSAALNWMEQQKVT